MARYLGMKKIAVLAPGLLLIVSTAFYLKFKYGSLEYLPGQRETLPRGSVSLNKTKSEVQLKPVTYYVVRNITWDEAAVIFENDLRKPVEYKCLNKRKLGNWMVCQDEPYTVKPPCLVYSFGIAFDFRFDDDMVKLGCEVHAFDPSMGKNDTVTKNGVFFHNIGLGSEDIDLFAPRQSIYVKDNQKWQLKTLKSIMKKLGHENAVLDVLKLDIEGHEWSVMENMINTNMFPKIRQFMLEWHLFPTFPAKSKYSKLLAVYQAKDKIGLQKYASSMHPLDHRPEKFNIQSDVWYVNSKFGPTVKQGTGEDKQSENKKYTANY